MAEQMVTKVTLGSGKVVLLREVKIKHTDLAAMAASPRANGDANVLMMLMHKELVKLLICQIDGKTPSSSELEDLDGLMSVLDFAQLSSVIRQLTGGSDMGKLPTTEVVPFGSK